MPPLDGTNDTIDEVEVVDFNNLNSIDVQNSLNDKGTSNSLEIQLDEYHDENDEMYDDKIDEYNNADYENYGEQDRIGGRPRNPGFGGRPQGQGGFGFRPQRTELYGR